jgi:hypothetical protein
MKPCRTILAALFLVIPIASPASADDLPDAEALVRLLLNAAGNDPQLAAEEVRAYVEGLTEEQVEELEKFVADPVIGQALACLQSSAVLDCLRALSEGQGTICLTPHFGLPSQINDLLPKYRVSSLRLPLMTFVAYDATTQSIQPGYYTLSYSTEDCGIGAF